MFDSQYAKIPILFHAAVQINPQKNRLNLKARGMNTAPRHRQIQLFRHSGRDCRNPVAMEGNPDSPPCVLDTGNPCRYDAYVGLAEESP